MAEHSAIEWTHHTFNPWWGCQRVSPGCEHCYAETFANRTGHKVWGPTADRRFFGEKHWAEPVKWNTAAEKAGERRRVFCASMADVFEDRRDLDGERVKLWGLIERTPMLDWQLLTKRPQNVAGMIPPDVLARAWIGTTAEDQRRADERIPHLLKLAAAVRFLSCEPLLEGLDLAKHRPGANRLWVIVGGESGAGARPCETWWVRNIVRQCQQADVPVFVKQLGARVIDRNDAGFEGDTPHSWPMDTDTQDLIQRAYQGDPVRVRLSDHKGGDMSEWPSDLRVRQFPTRER